MKKLPRRVTVAFAVCLLGVGRGNQHISAEIVMSKTITTSTKFIVGTPLQTLKTPVLVLSCAVHFAEPFGSSRQAVWYRYTVFNQTGNDIAESAITDRFDFSNYQAGYALNLKARQLRTFDNPIFGANSFLLRIFWGHGRPEFFLCGSGPDRVRDHTYLPFQSLALRDTNIVQWLIPRDTKGNAYSPFRIIKSRIVGSGSIIGVPIQPAALHEVPTFSRHPPTAKNLLRVVVSACSSDGTTATFSLFNQTNTVLPRIFVFAKIADQIRGSAQTNLEPSEYRTIRFPLSRPIEASRNIRIMACTATIGA